MRLIKKLIKKILPSPILDKIMHWDEYLGIISIKRALKHQRLDQLYKRLESIVPDISAQYTGTEIRSLYYKVKIRALHAFQIFLVQEALELLRLKDIHPFRVVDIGDSCGTHLQYLKFLYKDISDTLSVNLDYEAVKKIQKKGLPVVCAKAEEVTRYAGKADIYLSFEMLEHVHDPIGFLYSLSHIAEPKVFIVTVPYVRQSRVNLDYIRNRIKKTVYAENVHMFELAPCDWKLIFQHTGWAILRERIYLQYTPHDVFGLMKKYWKKVDYEGFYGMILTKDLSWSSLYKDW